MGGAVGDDMPVRVLVTGAGGYVGQAVVRRLARTGHEVVAMVRHRTADLPAGVRVVRADLLVPASLAAAVAGVEGVCHLAALTGVRASAGAAEAHHQTNAAGTRHLLDALAGSGAGPVRLVLASTAAVYGAPARQPVDEDAPCAPTSPYGSSKAAAEAAVLSAAPAGGLGAVILRTFNVAGAADGVGDPDRSRVIPKALAVAAGQAERLVINGDGRAVRDYLHVADVAAAFELALTAARPGQARVYNLGSGAGHSVLDIVATVRRLTGRSVPVQHRPATGESPVLLADPTRIRCELGWRPVRSGLAEIVADGWAAVPGVAQEAGG
jgi:UDP-glucose 4-epimerase